MKKLFLLTILSSTSILSADQQRYQNEDAFEQHFYLNQNQDLDDRQTINDRNFIRSKPEYQQTETNHNQNLSDKKVKSDLDIHKEIRNALVAGWFTEGYPGVIYTVYNGNVTLTGTVKHTDDIKKVEEKVKKLEGVLHVDNQLSVSNADIKRDNGYNSKNTNENNLRNYSESDLQESEKKHPQDSAATPQDRQLNARIRDKINSGWFSPRNEAIVLKTANGVVIITGTIERTEDTQKLEKDIKEINGVRSVNSNLSIQR